MRIFKNYGLNYILPLIFLGCFLYWQKNGGDSFVSNEPLRPYIFLMFYIIVGFIGSIKFCRRWYLIILYYSLFIEMIFMFYGTVIWKIPYIPFSITSFTPYTISREGPYYVLKNNDTNSKQQAYIGSITMSFSQYIDTPIFVHGAFRKTWGVVMCATDPCTIKSHKMVVDIDTIMSINK